MLRVSSAAPRGEARRSTFLTGEARPAVQAAAAAVATVTLRPVLTLAGFCAVRPVMIRSAVDVTSRSSLP